MQYMDPMGDASATFVPGKAPPQIFGMQIRKFMPGVQVNFEKES